MYKCLLLIYLQATILFHIFFQICSYNLPYIGSLSTVVTIKLINNRMMVTVLHELFPLNLALNNIIIYSVIITSHFTVVMKYKTSINNSWKVIQLDVHWSRPNAHSIWFLADLSISLKITCSFSVQHACSFMTLGKSGYAGSPNITGGTLSSPGKTSFMITYSLTVKGVFHFVTKVIMRIFCWLFNWYVGSVNTAEYLR